MNEMQQAAKDDALNMLLDHIQTVELLARHGYASLGTIALFERDIAQDCAVYVMAELAEYSKRKQA